MTANERRIRFLMWGLYCLYVQCLVSCDKRDKIVPEPPRPPAETGQDAEAAVANPACRARFTELSSELQRALQAAGHADFVGDLCAEQAAIASRSAAQCEALPTEHWRTHCVREVASARAEPTLCPWSRPSDSTRGRDPLCLARAADQSLLCSAITGSEDREECMRIFKLDALRPTGEAVVALAEHARTASYDSARGWVLLRAGSTRTLYLGDAAERAPIAASPVATPRLALVVQNKEVQTLVWRVPGEPALVATGEELKLEVQEHCDATWRGQLCTLVASGDVHTAGKTRALSLQVRSYLRDIVDVPKVEPLTPRPKS